MFLNCKNYTNINSYMPVSSTFRGKRDANKNNANNLEKGELGIKPIDNLVDKIDKETDKKQNKTALSLGIGVTAASLIIAIFNPRISSKSVNKLKNLDKKPGFVKWIGKFISSINNVNSVKDTYFKKLCTENKVLSKILKKPHIGITNLGDKLAKHTVKQSYKKANKEIKSLETLLKQYRKNLPAEKQREFDELMKNVSSQCKFFKEESINTRIIEQEKLMENLDKDIRIKFNDYIHGFKKGKRGEHFNNNLSFWAQDMMESKRAIINEKGETVIDTIISGDNHGNKGLKDIVNLLSEHIKPEEKSNITNSIENLRKRLRTANKTECNKYFDKKRDLTLGSAPTDILTSIVLLTTGGIAIAAADNKDDRISRLFTKVGPTVIGLGTNIALTSMLFSGTKGLLFGGLAAVVSSIVGHQLDNVRLKIKYQNGNVDSSSQL